MPTVSDILRNKNPEVRSIGKDATVLQAAQIMNQFKIGSLVVMEEDRVVGMFTERDILQRVVGEQREPAGTQVAEVMTYEVVCCSPQTTLDEARSAMKDRRIRHLPVVDEEGRLEGLISIGDLNAHESANNQHTIFLLEEYLHGRV